MAFNITKPPNPDEILNEKGFLSLFWKSIFKKAMELDASDIHIESLTSGLKVRLRVKGSLIQPFKIIDNSSEMVQLVDKFKEISGLDTSNKRVLQDSSFSLDFTNSTYRVSLSPGFQFGECAVLRIIDNQDIPNLEKIDLSLRARRDIQWALEQKQGLFLVTGPTGSGKSTTLQACIGSMDSEDKKIISIENPPERLINGVIHERITPQYSWSDAIKGAMRQDPDVILVGEIRDKESAKLAVEAAQTGHLVFSTLHTNNVPATVTRLLTLGIEKHLIADSLLFVSAQRLLKKLCDNCKVQRKSLHHRNKTGCDSCDRTGYSGRIPVLEYCISPDADLVFNFDHKNFTKALVQDLETETLKLVQKGMVDYHLVSGRDEVVLSNIVSLDQSLASEAQ